MTATPVTLAIGALETRIAWEGNVHARPIGFAAPGAPWRHAPPTPLEVEQAIEVVEEHVMPLARRLPRPARLVCADALALRLGPPGELGIAAVEERFNELAAIVQGRPAGDSPLADPALAGYLLILREVLHHLGFDRVTLA